MEINTLKFLSFFPPFSGSDGLKDVKLEGPGFVRRGENLRLRCSYDTENESLYVLKWYRGSEEFYRYLPKEVPPKQVFSVTGIVVDVSPSLITSTLLSPL